MARAVGLSPPAIVSAALEIADSEGIEKLTMRRLSAALDVTPMTIYHHVGDKEQLLDLVVDQSLGALPEIGPHGQADQQLRAFFLAFHHLLIKHPALAQAMAVRPLEGPIATRAAERALATLRRAGFEDEAAAQVFVSTFSFTLGASLYRISRTATSTGHFLPQANQETTSLVHHLRRPLAEAASNEDQFLRAIDKLLDNRPHQPDRTAATNTADRADTCVGDPPPTDPDH